jgi:hypothetical protein
MKTAKTYRINFLTRTARTGFVTLLLVVPGLLSGEILADQFPISQKTKFFEFRSSGNPAEIAAIARFADAFITVVNRDFFKAEFNYPIRVLVLPDRPAFQDFLHKQCQVAEPPNFGMYLSEKKMFITYEGSGLGTFAHEIMHPLVERNLPDRPVWAREGIPTFFEKFYGFWQNDQPTIYWGYQNPWRVEMLGTNLTRLNLKDILATKNPQGQFHESDLRMVSLFLWKQGKFHRFLELIQSHNKRGYDSYFEAAFGLPIERIAPLWEIYLRQVAADQSEINRLPPSALLENEKAFARFSRRFGLPVRASD